MAASAFLIKVSLSATVFGKHADADAATNIERLSLDNEIRAHRVHEPLGGYGDVIGVAHVRQQLAVFFLTIAAALVLAYVWPEPQK